MSLSTSFSSRSLVVALMNIALCICFLLFQRYSWHISQEMAPHFPPSSSSLTTLRFSPQQCDVLSDHHVLLNHHNNWSGVGENNNRDKENNTNNNNSNNNDHYNKPNFPLYLSISAFLCSSCVVLCILWILFHIHAPQRLATPPWRVAFFKDLYHIARQQQRRPCQKQQQQQYQQQQQIYEQQQSQHLQQHQQQNQQLNKTSHTNSTTNNNNSIFHGLFSHHHNPTHNSNSTQNNAPGTTKALATTTTKATTKTIIHTLCQTAILPQKLTHPGPTPNAPHRPGPPPKPFCPHTFWRGPRSTCVGRSWPVWTFGGAVRAFVCDQRYQQQQEDQEEQYAHQQHQQHTWRQIQGRDEAKEEEEKEDENQEPEEANNCLTHRHQYGGGVANYNNNDDNNITGDKKEEQYDDQNDHEQEDGNLQQHQQHNIIIKKKVDFVTQSRNICPGYALNGIYSKIPQHYEVTPFVVVWCRYALLCALLLFLSCAILWVFLGHYYVIMGALGIEHNGNNCNNNNNTIEHGNNHHNNDMFAKTFHAVIAAAYINLLYPIATLLLSHVLDMDEHAVLSF